jgi:hypothetical protein
MQTSRDSLAQLKQLQDQLQREIALKQRYREEKKAAEARALAPVPPPPRWFGLCERIVANDELCHALLGLSHSELTFWCTELESEVRSTTLTGTPRQQREHHNHVDHLVGNVPITPGQMLILFFYFLRQYPYENTFADIIEMARKADPSHFFPT